MNSRHAPDTCDVVVAGGGPAGCAAALALVRAGRAVLLADAGTGPPKLGEALVPAARVLLGDLGVADRVPGPGHLPSHGTLSAWGSAALQAVDSLHDPYGHGWHLDRRLFDRRLLDACRTAGAEVAERTAVRRPERQPDGGWVVTLRAGPTGPLAGRGARSGGERTVRCRWLIDATGRPAAIAVRCGARRRVNDRLTALHTTFDAEAPNGGGPSLVESDEDGWWYTAPLPGERRMVAYFTDSDLAATARTGPRFRRRLLATRHVSRQVDLHRLERTPPTAPGHAPAHTARTDRVYGDGWTTAGDAAVAFDPLSSQGILTALYTGLSAGQAVDARLRSGDEAALADYAGKVEAAHTAYLRGHHLVHAQETRWAHRPFWARRQAEQPLPHVRQQGKEGMP